MTVGPSPQTTKIELPARWSTTQRAKNTLIYWGIRTAVALLRSLPRVLLRSLAAASGRVAHVLAGRDRQRALEQLQRAMPELSRTEVRQTVRRMFLGLASSAFDVLILDRLLGQRRIELPAQVRALFESALEEGRGVVAVSGHVGNWELCAQSIAAAGFPLSVIASPLYDPRLTRMVDEFRGRNGAQVLWRGERTVGKDMLRVFKRNGVLAMLIDQDTKVQGAFVPFFGRPAHTPIAAAQLALRFRAPVIVGFVRHDRRGYRFDFERIHYDPDISADALTALLTGKIEHAIRESPEQWVWFHRRWKTAAPIGQPIESME